MVEKAKTTFEKFRLLTKRLVAVPKSEADEVKRKQERQRKAL